MKTFLYALSIVLVVSGLTACKGEPEVEIPPLRETVSIKYAVAPVDVKASTDSSSATIMTLNVGESVSIVTEGEEWSEVKLGLDKFGWVLSADLVSTKEGISSSEQNLRFRIPPEPITSPGIRGRIVLDASVNVFGEVTGVKVIENTTNRNDIEFQTIQSLKAAKFYPLLVEGKPKPFIYTYTATF